MYKKLDTISEAYISMLTEEIKGWKNASSDISKLRSINRDEAKNVKLVRLKKDGNESGMNDATKKFNSEEEARKHHSDVVGYNPKSVISHNLYIDGKLKETLR